MAYPPRHDVSLSLYDLDRAQLRSQADVWSGEDNPERAKYLSKVRDTLPKLPAVDRDLLRLYIIDGLTQRQIRRILGITQQGVCKRLASAVRRMEFFIGQPDLSEDMETLLGSLLPPLEAKILLQLSKTGYQSSVAMRSRLSSQWVNSLYLRAIQTLFDHPSLLAHYLAAWFIHLSAQRHIYDRPKRRR